MFAISLVYTLSIIFFYYLWYILIFIFAQIMIFFLKHYIKYWWSLEVKIYNDVLCASTRINNISILNDDILNRFDNFKEWEITNLWVFVENKFKDFYVSMQKTFKKIKIIEEKIPKSKFKEYINFSKLNLYLVDKFNQPIDKMISILEKFSILLKKQIEELKNIETDKQEFKSNFKFKQIKLENQVNMMINNKNKLMKMKI